MRTTTTSIQTLLPAAVVTVDKHDDGRKLKSYFDSDAEVKAKSGNSTGSLTKITKALRFLFA